MDASKYHDAAPGPLQHCQITGSPNMHCIIDLGHQPPCDALLTAEQLNQPEATYPLRLWHCPESGLAQLDYVVDGKVIYPHDYPYRAGVSAVLEAYQKVFATTFDGQRDDVRAVNGEPLVVDIGCNDGTLLKGFAARGWHTVGVEPTDTADIAMANGVRVAKGFFTEQLAGDLVAEVGEANLITMTNVFAHMAGLGEVMRGILRLLAKDGVFVTESHYLLDVFEKYQFDTIYHEHIRTYSLKALCTLFPMYGLEVFDVQRAERYGGNIRAYVCRAGTRPVHARVGELLALENACGLHTTKAWATWRGRVLLNRQLATNALRDASWAGLVGCSAPGRGATLLNFYGLRADTIKYVAEPPSSLKIGKYMPGSHIPVVDNSILAREQPANIVILAWHYADEIKRRLRNEGVLSNLSVPLPHYRVL